ncbi:MAG: Ig-like domain-containing protein [Bacteroidetes bacterium]|nr:Ig-like domain-containing protein [Bacteroidota bacterium]
MKSPIKYKLFHFISTLLLVSILFSCAQRSALTGGNKDVLPPEIKSTIPENQTLNFVDEEIVVEFNEFVRLNNLQNQLIVSPLMDEKPVVMIKGKKMVIKFSAKLAENTTYSLNFGDAIIDITESNPYPNYKYVFSTGNFIDSLSYSGKVVNAEDLSPKANVFVMLYNHLDDSLPIKQKPNYLAKTKTDGTFVITNIAKGQYKVFALDDINGNYLYDLPNEQLAFLNEPIQLDSNFLDSSLYLFTKQSEIQFVKKIENKQYGKLSIEFNIPTNEIELLNLDGEPYPFVTMESNKTKTQHTFWLNHEILENQQIFIIKDNDKIIDTSKVEMITTKEYKDTLLNVKSNVSSLFDLNQKIVLSSNQPFTEIQKEKIQLFEDSIPVNITLEKDSLSALNIHLIYPFKAHTNYKLLIEPEAFSSIYQLKNDTLINVFKTKNEEDYGNLKFTVIPDFQENYIIQLLQKNEILEEFFDTNTKTFNITYLKSGEYQIKLIIDRNTNKKWDTGNYQLNLQPEKVIFYQDKITIRENWDNEIQWNIKL